MKNPHVNKGNRDAKPQIVGFYKTDYTLDKVKENIKPYLGMVEVDKYMSIFPTLENFFLAAKKGTPYITEMLPIIADILAHPDKVPKMLQGLKLKGIRNDANNHCFFIACQMVLQARQAEIDTANKNTYR
jgi:hypothetical protein